MFQDDSSYDEKKMLELQKRIIDETAKNRARMNLYEAIVGFVKKFLGIDFNFRILNMLRSFFSSEFLYFL